MNKQTDQINCPRCGKPLEDRKSPCPHCGYAGYIPMSEAQIKKTKLILYPVFAIIAIFIIIFFWFFK